jgi:hypothetical protein
LNSGGSSGVYVSQNVLLWPGKHHIKIDNPNGVYEWDFEITW